MRNEGEVQTIDCKTCWGLGYVMKQKNAVGFSWQDKESCPVCDGYGFVIKTAQTH